MSGDGVAVHPKDPSLERLNTLSDGVFAIAMTLMALDVHGPAHWDHTTSGLLAGLAGPFQAFFWSFFATALFWVTHRRLFLVCTRSTPVLTGLNLFLLGEITLIPVLTRMLTELLYLGGVLDLYLGLYFLIGVTNAALFVYATRIARITQAPPGPWVVVVGAGTMAFVPVVMTALGVLSVLPELRWLPSLMPLVFAVSFGSRRLAGRLDARRSRKAADGKAGK